MTAGVEPPLAPPGAGLPRMELYIGRLLFAFRRRTGNRDAFNACFERERRAIRSLAGSCDAASAACRVLIARPRGIEDSSRYWSVWMTLDHLRIVNLQIDWIIGSLAKAVVPPSQASTANVKPGKAVTGAVVAEYEAACDHLLSTVAGIQDLRTQARYRHPWFGLLDASGWHALAGGHMGLHRVQIERILQGLPAASR